MAVQSHPTRWASETARGHNRAHIMKLILSEPGVDRTRLAEATCLTNAAVTRIVQELVSAELVQDTQAMEAGTGRGRKRLGLEINPSGGFVLGMSILAINSNVVLSDMCGRIVDLINVEPHDISNPEKTLDEFCAVALQILQKHNIDRSRVLGAGVAVAGFLDPLTGAVERAPYLGWPPFDLKNSVKRRLKMPVACENVNRCIAAAEVQFGSCQGISDLVLIRAALGLGGAIISGGEFVRGARNLAGQIGHIPIDPKGLRCSCGSLGCLNTLASGWAVLHEMGLSNLPVSDHGWLESNETKLKKLLSSSESDKKVQRAFKEAGAILGRHCVSLLSTLDPQAVILTGPLGRNRFYCDGFEGALRTYGIAYEIKTAFSSNIVSPAAAASALALSSHVYSPSFDLQPLIAPRQEQLEGAKVL